ncbi:MAG: OmpW family outer membrane protein [Steroidobacteraceae bacterium]
MKLKTGIFAAVALAAVPFANAGDLLIRGGVHNVDPKSSNDLEVDVSSNATLSVGVTWFLTKNIAVDLLGALPFKHDIDDASGAGLGTIATVKHLPPTLGVQYHFNPGGTFDPYVGAGLNVTLFFSEEGKGALAGVDVSASSSVGPALQLGGDFALGKDWVLGVDLRWAKIGTDVSIGGVDVGKLDLDPLVYGITIGRRFAL